MLEDCFSIQRQVGIGCNPRLEHLEYAKRSEELNLPESPYYANLFVRAPFAFTAALLCSSLLCGSFFFDHVLNLLSFCVTYHEEQ